MKGGGVKPNFIGVGMERSGTSWLYKMLAAHPDIWVPPIKEIHYFDRVEKGFRRNKSRFRRHLFSRLKHRAALVRRYEDRPEFYKNNIFEYLLWDFFYFTGDKSDVWYQKLFAPVFVKGRVAGEITPAYANISQEVIKGMVKGLPDAKFIIMLRHPFDRLKSGLFHHFKVEQGRHFCTVQDYEMVEYIKRVDVQQKSSASHILAKWSRHVKADNLFISVQNNDLEGAENFLSEIYDFVGVDSAFKPEKSFVCKRVNVYSSKEDDESLPKDVVHLMREFSDQEIARLQKSYPQIAKLWLDER